MSKRSPNILLLALVFMTAALSAGGENAAFDPGGRSFSITAAGLGKFHAAFSATMEEGGQQRVLDSSAGSVLGFDEKSTEPTPYGTASVTVSTIHFEKERCDLLLRLGQVPGVPGVLLQAGLRNTGNTPVKLASFSALADGLKPEGLPEGWLITGWQAPMLKITALNEITTPLEVREAGGVYRADGVGFLFGPVGAPVAYVAGSFTALKNGRMSFTVTADMSGAKVDPGETRWGQQVALLMEKPGPAMARWAEWVGKTHGARTSKGALCGWNSWNFRTNKTNEKELLKVAESVQRSAGRMRPAVIQIDDSVQTAHEALTAPWLPVVAKAVRETGARFGLRLNFDRNGESAADGMKEFTGTVRRAVISGFSYLKITYPRATERAADEKRTAFEIFRDDWAAIRNAAGEDTYLLYAGGGDLPDRAVVGSVDACRVGSDASRFTLRKALQEVLPSFALNGRWFTVDPDVYYMAGEIPGMCSVEGGAPMMQTWLSVVGLSCGTAITSEPFYWREFEPHWRNTEVLNPPASERTELIHFGMMPAWSALVGHVHRTWGDSTVALLFNAVSNNTVSLAPHFDFAQAGLDPDRRYAVWSFWDNQFLGIAKGKWSTPVLPNGYSQHLLFTDLDRTPERPVLIGSNLHIYCGAAEIKNVTSSRAAMQIELTDAGARAGDLFVYSRWPLVFKTAAGCALADIVNDGGNIWRISLADRQHGVPQRLEFSVVLPFTRHLWFWLVVGTLVASLLFTWWRYIVGLRLKRALAFDAERARIARDLHDQIGANLTRISLLGAIAAQDAKEGRSLLGDVQEMAAAARETHRAVGEIVWSFNPRHDTTASLVHYLCRYAEEFFTGSPVKCRFQIPEGIPDHPLPPQARHDLFLAVKEALNNILKHARATEVELTVQLHHDHMIVEVSDNGAGFDPARQSTTGNGLRNMQERMKATGGTMTLHSSPENGTRLTFDIPVNHGSPSTSARKK